MITRKKPPNKRIERQIAIGAITSTSFLAELVKMYKPECIASKHINHILSWCIEYYEGYDEAPGKQIQDLFLSKTKLVDDASREQIEIMLSGLSDEFENVNTFNSDYYLDESEKHFSLQKLENIKTELSKSITGGRITDAENLIANYSRITRRPATQGIDPLRDHAEIAAALSKEQSNTMFAMPGDLGKMIAPFQRDQFAMIVASMGKGKTWMLQEVAMQAVFSGFNVLFVSLELSRKQMTARIHHRLSGLPAERYAGDIWLPVFDCAHNQTGDCNRHCSGRIIETKDHPLPKPGEEDGRYEPCTACRGEKDFEMSSWYKKIHREPLDEQSAIRKAQAIVKGRIKGAKFKLIDPPPNSLKFSELRTMIDNWEYYEGWTPDVVITDYADKFAAESDSPKEYRHMIYRMAVDHKALAKEKHILVVSASQSNTGRDEDADVDAGGFAEDIRKKAEIDVGFALNQTSVEKQMGRMRINMLKIRDDLFDTKTQCTVLQQLKIGRPYLDSYWPDRRIFYGK